VPQLEQLGEATLEQLQDRDRRVAALQEELQHCYQHHRSHSSSGSSAVGETAAAAAEARSVSPRRRSRHRDSAGGSSTASTANSHSAAQQQQQQHVQQRQHLAVLAHSAHTLRSDLRALAATVRRERAAVDSACDAALSSLAQRRRWSPSRRRYAPALTVAVSPAAAAPMNQQQAFSSSSSSDYTTASAAAAAAHATAAAGEAATRWRAQAERAASVLQLVANVLSTELGVTVPQLLLMLNNSSSSSDSSSGALPLRELEQFQAALTLQLQHIRSSGRSEVEAELATVQVCCDPFRLQSMYTACTSDRDLTDSGAA
jgi:hypothetical protein